jgi:hypothetical protein
MSLSSLHIEENCVGFEVFIAVVMKSIILWDVMPCSLLSCNRRFGGTYRLHLQGRLSGEFREIGIQGGGFYLTAQNKAQ